MQVGITTYGYLYRSALETCLKSIAAAGFRLVEVAPAPPHLLLTQGGRDSGRALRHVLESSGLNCASINPPEMNLISPNPDLREVALRHYRESIRLASHLGAQIVVVIPGRQSQLIPMPTEAATKLAIDQLSLLAKDAHEYLIDLAIEPVPFGFAESTADVANLVNRMGDERVGMAIDVANIFGREDIPNAVSVAAPALKIAHLSDTWRDRWAHTAIGTGEVDFAAFIGALADNGFTGPCIYELVDGVDPTPRIARDLAHLKRLGLAS